MLINNEKKKKLNAIESSFPGIGYVMPCQELEESTVLITGILCVFENSNALWNESDGFINIKVSGKLKTCLNALKKI
jgi:hypothetical protein